MRRLVAIFVLCLSASACAQGPSSRPFMGVTYAHEVRKDPPMHLHAVTVGLTDPTVHLVVRPAGEDPDGEGPWETTLMRTSQIAERDHLDGAVNRAFFMAQDVLVTPFRKVPYYSGHWAIASGW